MFVLQATAEKTCIDTNLQTDKHSNDKQKQNWTQRPSELVLPKSQKHYLFTTAMDSLYFVNVRKYL